jgi:maltooligosyltrehalose trehalohydrolase
MVTSQALDINSFSWSDSNWNNIPLADYIIYELHSGTFTEDGNFTGIERKLDFLKELGITAIELMPLAQFPGERNWGYDGVYPFAIQNSYGGINAFQKLSKYLS